VFSSKKKIGGRRTKSLEGPSGKGFRDAREKDLIQEQKGESAPFNKKRKKKRNLEEAEEEPLCRMTENESCLPGLTPSPSLRKYGEEKGL